MDNSENEGNLVKRQYLVDGVAQKDIPKEISSFNGMDFDKDDPEEVVGLNFKQGPQSTYLLNKAKDILNASDISHEKWIEYALSEGGLVSDEIRKEGWPRLLELDPSVHEVLSSEESLQEHPEYSQVVLDVNRSLKRFPPGIPYQQRLALQYQLTNLILRVITKYPHLRYYQGYHDVAITFLLVVGEELAFRIMERLSTDHLRDCMEPTMEKTSHLLNYIFPLIDRLDSRLCSHIERSGAGTMFCLPWFLTWFGHSLNHYKDVVRLYDFFLASPPLMPLYLTATIVAYRAGDILNLEPDMATVHCFLSLLPDDLPFDDLIKEAVKLYASFPPESVEAEVYERTRKDLDGTILKKVKFIRGLGMVLMSTITCRDQIDEFRRKATTIFESIKMHTLQLNIIIICWSIVRLVIEFNFLILKLFTQNSMSRILRKLASWLCRRAKYIPISVFRRLRQLPRVRHNKFK